MNNIQLPEVKVIWAVLVPILIDALLAVIEAIESGSVEGLDGPVGGIIASVVTGLIAMAVAYLRKERRPSESAKLVVIDELAERRLLTDEAAARDLAA